MGNLNIVYQPRSSKNILDCLNDYFTMEFLFMFHQFAHFEDDDDEVAYFTVC